MIAHVPLHNQITRLFTFTVLINCTGKVPPSVFVLPILFAGCISSFYWGFSRHCEIPPSQFWRLFYWRRCNCFSWLYFWHISSSCCYAPGNILYLSARLVMPMKGFDTQLLRDFHTFYRHIYIFSTSLSSFFRQLGILTDYWCTSIAFYHFEWYHCPESRPRLFHSNDGTYRCLFGSGSPFIANGVLTRQGNVPVDRNVKTLSLHSDFACCTHIHRS